VSEKQTEEQRIEALRREHDDLVVIGTKLGRVAFRPPTSGEYQRLQDKLGDSKKSNAAAMREFVVCCRVYPEASDFMAVLDRYPALVTVAADALHEAAGGGLTIEGKG
jgi:hypothetical protein